MIETLTDPLIMSVMIAGFILLCAGLIALRQDNKKKTQITEIKKLEINH